MQKKTHKDTIQLITDRFSITETEARDIIRLWTTDQPAAASYVKVKTKEPVLFSDIEDVPAVHNRTGRNVLISVVPQGSRATLVAKVIRVSYSHASADGARRTVSKLTGIEMANLVSEDRFGPAYAKPPLFSEARESREGQDWNDRQEPPTLSASY